MANPISSWYSECLNTLTLILNQCGPSINLIVLLSNWILFDKDNHLILFRSSAPPSYNNDPGINSHPRYSWHNFRQICLIHMQVICLLCWQCYTIHHSLTTLTTTTCFPLLNSAISDLLFWSHSCHSKTLLCVWSESPGLCVRVVCIDTRQLRGGLGGIQVKCSVFTIITSLTRGVGDYDYCHPLLGQSGKNQSRFDQKSIYFFYLCSISLHNLDMSTSRL